MSALCRCSTGWRVNFERRGWFGVARGAPIADTEPAAQAIPGEGVATMTTFWVRAALAAAGVLALQACTIGKEGIDER